MIDQTLIVKILQHRPPSWLFTFSNNNSENIFSNFWELGFGTTKL